MPASRFDRLSHRLSGAASRRALGGLAVGSAATMLADNHAQAKNKNKKKKKCPKRDTCPEQRYACLCGNAMAPSRCVQGDSLDDCTELCGAEGVARYLNGGMGIVVYCDAFIVRIDELRCPI